MRAALPAVLALPAAQAKDGESPDRGERTRGPGRRSLMRCGSGPPGRAGVATAVSGATGEGEARQGQSPGLPSASPAASPAAGQRGYEPRGGAGRDARHAAGASGWGSSGPPQAPAAGDTRGRRPRLPAPPPSGWPEAKSGTASRVSQTPTGPGGGFQNQGQIRR